MYHLFFKVFSGNEYITHFFCHIVALMTFTSGFSAITVFSRIAYSMARDGAFPHSDYLKVLDPLTQVPTRIILLLFLVSSVLNCLPLFST